MRKREDIRIVFMGTPDFAVTTLSKLVAEGFNVVGVVTMPDKPMGRHGSVLQSSPVKRYAESVGLPVLQPERLKSELFLQELSALRADIQIVVAFRMLPEVVWSMPRMGTFNLHASLLPQYRGAAPINWALINGEKRTGVTTFFLQHDIDTGDIIKQREVEIEDSDNAATLHDKLMNIGANLVVESMDDIIQGCVTTQPQPSCGSEDIPLHAAPKIFKPTCKIDWSLSGVEVMNFIRGLSPYPAAWTKVTYPDGGECEMKIYRAHLLEYRADYPIGTILTDGKREMHIVLRDTVLAVDELQLSGRKRMDVSAMLCGNSIEGAVVE